MTDVFKEQLVVKKSTAADHAKRILVLVGAAIFVLGCVAVLPFTGQFWFFPVLGAGIAIYVVFKYYPLLYTEYEYIFTNGQLDVDKILGRQSRKRLITTDAEVFEEFGRYTASALEGREFDTRLFACTSPEDPDAYYIVTRHPSYQNTLIVFNPNDVIVSSIKEFLPRTAIIHE